MARTQVAPITDAPKHVFRGDIDGLRALAIVIVVGFHVGLPGFSGGFVGVDVFFVMSGFLITGVLLRDQAGGGRIRLLDFWGRRIRRLVPAMGLMVVTSLILALAVLPAVSMDEVGRQARAASLYLSNILYARDASDYFAVDSSNSPFLHTWSLGVEEQFYLFWPLLVLLVGVVGIRSQRFRTVAVVGIAGVLAVSFVINLNLTDSGSPWAFFGLPARLWELAAGGLLAAAPRWLRSSRPDIRTLEVGLGIALIVYATLTLDDHTPFPGTAALLPVLGAMLVIHGGDPSVPAEQLPVSRALARRPFQFIGRLSYSWYLWHWPLIVLGAAWLEDTTGVRSAAVVVALGVAWLAYRYVECPVRFSPALVQSLPKTYLMGAAVTVLAVGASFAVQRSSEATETDLDVELREAREGRREYQCEERVSPSGVEYCESGDTSSDITVMLDGDSFARHWKAALGTAAWDERVRLVDRFYLRCPTIDLEIAISDMAECAEHRAESGRLIEELEPDVVVLSNAPNYLKGINPLGAPDMDVAGIWADALAAQIDDLEEKGIEVAIIHANPIYETDPVECVANERAPEACAKPRAEALALGAEVQSGTAAVLVERPDIPVFSVEDLLCDDEQCVVAVDGVLAYSDKDHLSPKFTAGQVDRLREFVAALTPVQLETASAG